GAMARAPEEVLRPALFLLDRSLASEKAAAVVQNAKVPLAEFAGDVGTIWSDRLLPLWRAAPQPIAGVTYGGALFCIEHLARSHGMVGAFGRAAPEQVPVEPVELARVRVRGRFPAPGAGAVRPDRPVVSAMVPRMGEA